MSLCTCSSRALAWRVFQAVVAGHGGAVVLHAALTGRQARRSRLTELPLLLLLLLMAPNPTVLSKIEHASEQVNRL